MLHVSEALNHMVVSIFLEYFFKTPKKHNADLGKISKKEETDHREGVQRLPSM
jgi:hypothetical protein